ncbi:MAG: Flp pilus assembly protein CpaB [Ruminococcaceae bacterium]|nr:Flp pilus assembly protein CpaB [Oscillospiraceae bacterium]
MLLLTREEFDVKKIRIIALIAAVLTFLIVLAIMNQKSRLSPDVAGAKTSVVVAAKDIPSSSVLTKDMLTTKSMSAKDVPADALTDPSEAVGRISTTKIKIGEQIVQSNTSSAGDSKYGLAVRLPNGMRAVTLDFESDTQGRLSNLLRVGNRVDVAAVLDEDAGDGKGKQTGAEMILQNQEIVALNDSLSNPDPTDEKEEKVAYQTVTLSVTPEDSLKLLAFQKRGSVRLILRPQSDQEKKEIKAFVIS